MRHFWLLRLADASGISGTGIVAEGTILSNGWCVLNWLATETAMAFYPSIKAIEKVHGHEGRTRVVYNLPMMKARAA